MIFKKQEISLKDLSKSTRKLEYAITKYRKAVEFDIVEGEILEELNNIKSRRRNKLDLTNDFGIIPNSVTQALALKYLEILESRLPKDVGDILRNEKEEK